ncbi:MAG: hypothetical protein Kow00121_31070 [Elainellaceae cyanobacterium]
MKLKLSHTVVWSAALATAFTLTLATSSSACMFSGTKGGFDPIATDSPAGSDTAIDGFDSISRSMESSGLNRWKLGAGLVAVAGLVAGGLALKARHSRTSEAFAPEASQADLLTEDAFAASTFAIEVPPEALRSTTAAEDTESDLVEV